MLKLKVILLSLLMMTPVLGNASDYLNSSLCIVTTDSCFTVIKHDSQLPITFSYTFTNGYDNQKEVRIELKKRFSASEEYAPAGYYDLPITELPASKARLHVQITVDRENQVTIHTQDMDSGVSNSYDAGYLY